MGTEAMDIKSWTRVSIQGAVFVLAYFVLGTVGVPLDVESIEASPVWLPHGLSVAAIIILGARFWPAVLIAVGARAFVGGLPLLPSLGLGVAKLGEVLLAIYLMRRLGRFAGRPRQPAYRRRVHPRWSGRRVDSRGPSLRRLSFRSRASQSGPALSSSRSRGGSGTPWVPSSSSRLRSRS